MSNTITIKGARVHNLKNVDVTLPRNKLIVFTGLSGSGKSSLAFDTIYAEGQRRYVESLSAYARQFLEQLDKPDVDVIEGLSPAISIDQKTASHNPRSTVGTVTEIYDYLRLLFSSIGKPHCPNCHTPIQRQSIQEICDHLHTIKEGAELTIYAPIITNKKGEHQNSLTDAKKDGFTRVRVDGQLYRLDEPITMDKRKAHTIEIVIDRLPQTPDNHTRLFESVETAVRQSQGTVLVESDELSFSQLYSEQFACSDCQFSFREVSPRLFSFNSPVGACPECKGLGERFDFDPELVIEDEELPVKSATQNCINLSGTIYGRRCTTAAKEAGFAMTTPVKDLTDKQRQIFLYGIENPPEEKFRKYRGKWRSVAPRHWEGVLGNLSRRYKKTYSEGMRFFFRRFMSAKVCSVCEGQRLNQDALAVKVANKTIHTICNYSIEEGRDFFKKLKLTKKEREIATLVLKEIEERLSFLDHVGLSYLTLDRRANTLSGGEHQRIRLATQIGSGLTGVLYVLDEPSIGLHQRDNERLLDTLKALRDLGNTLIVVEHDEDTIHEADYIVDIGPKAGRDGGDIVFAGTLEDLKKNKQSITANYLTKRMEIPIPKKRRPIKKSKQIHLKGASANNLKKVTVGIPLEALIVVTGVSGSGKSTLIYDTVHRILMKELHKSRPKPGAYDTITGLEHIDKVITIDQSPIGRTPRSNPATYVGAFTPIRELFAKTRDARMKGYKAGRFSFNVKGGRCEACQGDGMTKIEMHFLSDVYVTCEVCKGHRYNEQTLEVTFKGYSISDVLNMTVNQAVDVFESIPQIATKLKTLQEVGLGYIHVGQSATTLSGGEAQRIKLAKELSKRSTGKTVYLLDEPTTGLHFEDVKKLLGVLNALVDQGNTVLVIEHNIDVIKTADHIIDLGPEGGKGGGEIVAEGTPEAIAKVKKSYTGDYLKKVLKTKNTTKK